MKNQKVRNYRRKSKLISSLMEDARIIGCYVYWDSLYWLTTEEGIIAYTTPNYLNMRTTIESIKENLKFSERRSNFTINLPESRLTCCNNPSIL